MNYRPFGNTQWQVSEVGFGAWAIGGGWGPQDDAESLKALHKALDLGVNFIDTAAGYGNGRSERIIGQLLKERGGGAKDRIYVATKTHPENYPGGVWPPNPNELWQNRYSEKYLRSSVEERLKNLGVETLDVLQLHTWTRAWNRDPQPFHILRKLQKEGKIRYIGISTPEHDQNAVNDLMTNKLVDVVQTIYNIFEQEPAAELLPIAQATNTAIIVRVVFDEGALIGKFTAETVFQEGDFRRRYFAGDRLARTVERAEKIKADLADT
ncbi:MAG: aldo/keto reductase, partial [Phycisphaerales bacterium]|nr:aldo/keto reductase [Phycisphaerales bacterium]